MTIYLLDCIAFATVHRRRFAFDLSPLGDWEHVQVLKAWQVVPPDGTTFRAERTPDPWISGFGALYSAETFKLALEAGAVAGLLIEVPHHGLEKI